MKTNIYQLILISTVLFLNSTLFAPEAFSQCTASFTYIVGSNGAITFTPNMTGGTPPYSYQWDFGDMAYDTASNPTHVYSYNTTYHVCLTAASVFPCYDSVCSNVVVSNGPQNVICAGNANFTATPNGSAIDFKNTAGKWEIRDFGDSSPAKSSGSNTISHQYSLNGTYQVVAIAYSNFGSLYLPCDTDTVNITANNIPCTAGFTYWVDTTGSFACNDSSLGAVNRTWYINGVIAASNVTYFQSPHLSPGTYSVCLVITGPLTCKDSTCQSIVLNYTVPTPACIGVSFTYSPLATPCDSYQFNLVNTGPAITSIAWALNSTTVSAASTANITLNFSTPPFNTPSQSVSVVVNGPGCKSTGSFSFNNLAGYWIWLDTTGGSNTWYAYPNNKTNVASELWDFGDGTTSTLAFPTHIYSTPGFYNVCHSQILANGCSYKYCYNGYFYRMDMSQAISYFVVVGATSINEKSFLAGFKVYPNPSSSVIHFDFSRPVKETLTLGIYNSLGALVKASDIPEKSTLYIFNIADMAIGIYYYKIMGLASDEASYGKIHVVR